MTNSRQKGARAERELAKILREHGFEEARRGQQFSGLGGEDVVGLPMIHIEAKHVEKLNLRLAMEQSQRDAKEDQVPVVMHKKNRKPWLVTLSLEDFLAMYRYWIKEWME